jgi:uncharacterized protein
MTFEGEEHFAYDVAAVWAALHDVEVLGRAIPGCKSLTTVASNVYVVALSLGVAAVKGEYEGTVKVADVKPLAQYNIEGEGKGAPGFVRLRMDCRFEPQQGGTLMRWKCDAVVGGVIASIGGKVLSGISKFMAQQFFRAVKDELAKGEEAHRPAAAASANASTGAPASGALGNWFARLWAAITRRAARRPIN